MERHRAGKYDWDVPPARSAELAAVVTEQLRHGIAADPRAPARKNTRHWCRGRPGREHQRQLREVQNSFHPRSCEWRPRIWDSSEVAWHCAHEEFCAACGKILRTSCQLALADCPAYPGSPEQKAAAEAQAAQVTERYLTWSQRRNQQIHGRQSYRKPKAVRA
jgi:hypothetical protein